MSKSYSSRSNEYSETTDADLENIRKILRETPYILDQKRNDLEFINSVYNKLPNILVESITNVSIKLSNSLTIQKEFDKIKKQNKLKSSDSDILFKCLSILFLKGVSHFDIFGPNWNDLVFGYLNPELICKFDKVVLSDEKLISSKEKSKIAIAKLVSSETKEIGREIVVKTMCLTSDICYELMIYKKLRSLKCPLPWFSLNYSFWGQPIILLKRLKPLNMENPKSINLSKLCRDILSQLIVIHKIGVYCDIKPANIMYDPEEDKYFLIDFDAMTIIPSDEPYYYVRHAHTKIFSSQRYFAHTKEPCSAINDLKELGYVINYILYKRTNASYEEIVDNFRISFLGKCGDYMKRVKKLGLPVTSSMYSNLAKIL